MSLAAQSIERESAVTPQDHDAILEMPIGERLAAAPLLVAAAIGVVLGGLSLSLNSLDGYRLFSVGAIALMLAALVAHNWYRTGAWDRTALALLALSLAGIVLLAIWPEYLYGHQLNGIIHRSLPTAFVLLGLGLPAVSLALYYMLGATPTAADTSRYPLLLFPILLTLLVYGAILLRLIEKGAPELSLDILTTAYDSNIVTTGATSAFVSNAGMRNHLLGTLLLMAMTSAISLPIGVGTGIFLSESDGWFARIVEFSTLMLRAISVFILGVTAFTLADFGTNYAVDTPISDLLRGYYRDDAGFKIPAHGSFLMASVVLSLLVVPVIARATEEGMRSVPRDIREGSVALGATEGRTLLRILLPWSLPNIVTGTLLGSSEAAGSVAVLLFVAGSGQFGIGPLNEVTSLAFLVFDSKQGSNAFTDVMAPYQFTAALLLICITFLLSISALVLKQRFAARYRGAVSYR